MFIKKPNPIISQHGYSISYRSIKKIKWPSLLKRPKLQRPKWLKVNKRPRLWGLDWWEDDYYFGTEWMLKFPVDVAERSTIEYWESVLEDFSKTPPRVKVFARYRKFQHKRIVTYKQPFFLKNFFRKRIVPIQRWFERRFVPSLLGEAMAYQELKYTTPYVGGLFWWEHWLYHPRFAWRLREDAEDLYFCQGLYLYDRRELVEKHYDYLLLDTFRGKLITVYYPRYINIIGRFFLDIKNVPFFSVWLDLMNRGFSLRMLKYRWRYHHKWLPAFSYIELYVLALLGYLYYLQKHHVLFYSEFFRMFLFCYFSFRFALFFDRRYTIMDLWMDWDKEAVSKYRDKPVKDQEVLDLFDPPDTLHTHVSDPFDVSLIAQDELYFPARHHYSASLLTSSWWLESNERLSSFVYHADRDWFLREREDKTMRIYYLLNKYFPGSVEKFFEWKMPGFRFVKVISHQFFWWVSWREHLWTFWGKPLKPMHTRFSRFVYMYEWCKGILAYAWRIIELQTADLIREHSYIDYDWWADHQEDVDDINDFLECYPYTRRPHRGWYAKISKGYVD
jgi:hypothetical protein